MRVKAKAKASKQPSLPLPYPSSDLPPLSCLPVTHTHTGDHKPTEVSIRRSHPNHAAGQLAAVFLLEFVPMAAGWNEVSVQPSQATAQQHSHSPFPSPSLTHRCSATTQTAPCPPTYASMSSPAVL